MDITSRRTAGLLGLLIGDAAGVPFEFSPPQVLSNLPAGAIDFPPALPSDFRRSHETAPRGSWSDDGAMALALLASLDHCQCLDLDDLSSKFLNWKNEGHYAPGEVVFDIGNQVKIGLRRIEAGAAPHTTGPCLDTDNGNGSLMRVLPLALWHIGSSEQLCEWAHQQSLPTHGHMRAQVCCALYCLWARELLGGAKDGFEEALMELENIYVARKNMPALRELAVILDDENIPPRGTGYVVDTLWSVRQAFLASKSFDGAIKHAISLGNDTDTVAALTGGLAGIRAGMEGLPSKWVDELAVHPALDHAQEVLTLRCRVPRPSF